MVACAVGKRPLGIDVEYKKQIEYRPLADHFFHKNELEYINKVDPGAGLDQFYKLWTLKETWIREAQANINTFKSTFYKDFRDSKVQKFLHPLGDKNLAFKKLESCVNICFSV